MAKFSWYDDFTIGDRISVSDHNVITSTFQSPIDDNVLDINQLLRMPKAEFKTKNSTKRQLCCRLVEFLVFNSICLIISVPSNAVNRVGKIIREIRIVPSVFICSAILRIFPNFMKFHLIKQTCTEGAREKPQVGGAFFHQFQLRLAKKKAPPHYVFFANYHEI